MLSTRAVDLAVACAGKRRQWVPLWRDSVMAIATDGRRASREPCGDGAGRISRSIKWVGRGLYTIRVKFLYRVPLPISPSLPPPNLATARGGRQGSTGYELRPSTLPDASSLSP